MKHLMSKPQALVICLFIVTSCVGHRRGSETTSMLRRTPYFISLLDAAKLLLRETAGNIKVNSGMLTIVKDSKQVC